MTRICPTPTNYWIASSSARSKIAGVARVQIQGVAPPEVQVELVLRSPDGQWRPVSTKLYKTLSEANFSVSAGQVNDGVTRYRVQPQGEWRNLDDIPTSSSTTVALKLGDIASVSLRPERLDYMRHLDLKPAVGVDI